MQKQKHIFFLLLTLFHHIHTQNCSSLYISAIYPCTIHFQLEENSCLLSSCTTKSPGTQINQTSTNVCFVSCCPGFKVPSVLSKDNLMECYNQFNHEPILVYIIGILFAVFITAICVILPCCRDKECPLFRLRQKMYEKIGRRQKGKSKQSQKLKKKSQTLLPVKSLLQMSKLAIGSKNYLDQEPATVSLDFELMIKQKEDDHSSSQNICRLCSKQHASCKLACTHLYHWECIATSWQHLNCCPLCEKKQIFPLTQYCQKCFKVGVSRNSLTQSNEPYVCSNCK